MKPCLVGKYQCFGESSCPSNSRPPTVQMEAHRSHIQTVMVNQTARGHIPGNSNFVVVIVRISNLAKLYAILRRCHCTNQFVLRCCKQTNTIRFWTDCCDSSWKQSKIKTKTVFNVCWGQLFSYMTVRITKAIPNYTAHKKSIISFIVRWCNYYNEVDIAELRQLSRMMNYLPLSSHAEFGRISS